MIVTVRDPSVLANLDPQQLERYLQQHGWRQEERIDNRESIWAKQTQTGESLDLALPLNPKMRSFALRMSEILATLEVAEGRSQMEILSDVLTAATDIQIHGVVLQLNAESDADNVILMGFVLEKPWKIHLHLTAADYRLATTAYQERLPVVCSGNLIEQGGDFWLQPLAYFALEHRWQR